jgi:hypothetical protein
MNTSVCMDSVPRCHEETNKQSLHSLFFSSAQHQHYQVGKEAIRCQEDVTTSSLTMSATSVYNRQVLVGDHLVLRDFGPYGIIFMSLCALITLLW